MPRSISLGTGAESQEDSGTYANHSELVGFGRGIDLRLVERGRICERSPIERIALNNFADRFVLRMRELGHPLCVGIDPYLDRIPPLFRRMEMAIGSPETSEAVSDFCLAVLDQLTGRVAIIKPQIALFEQLGWRGIRILERVIQVAHERGTLVLLDAKRGDIGAVADGYATAYLSGSSSISADAITVNPYLGREALEPFVRQAGENGRGVVVLVRNSNPGASDYQDLRVGDGTLFESVDFSLRPYQDALMGEESGWSSLCVTTAATRPRDLV